MRRSARTDLCGGRSAMIVPTASTAWSVPSFENRKEVLELIEFCFLPSCSDYGRARVLSSDLVTSLNQNSSGGVVGFCPDLS
jgi:hypothetical protein